MKFRAFVLIALLYSSALAVGCMTMGKINHQADGEREAILQKLSQIQEELAALKAVCK